MERQPENQSDEQPIESGDDDRPVEPWKVVGVPIEGRVTVHEALNLAQCDWTAIKLPQQLSPVNTSKLAGLSEDELGMAARLRQLQNPEQCMVVRLDTGSYLGSVGSRYTVVQNHDAFAFFDQALGEGAACVEAVGVMGKYGARVFLVAKVPDMLEIVPGDPVQRYVMLTSTHDGSGNIEAMFVNWRRASNSGVQLTTKKMGRVRIRHTRNAKDHLKQAHMVLHQNKEYWERAIRAYRYMAKRSADAKRVRAFLEAMFPDKTKENEDGKKVTTTSAAAQRSREAIETLFQGGAPGASIAGATDWGLYNAVAYFVEHERPQRSKRATSHWEVSTVGPGAVLRARAFNWLNQGV